MLDLRLEYEYMKEDIDAAIQKCLEHQRWILGPEVAELEERMADYLGVKYCIGCSSGTDALVLSLRALAIKHKNQEYWDRDDLIITTPFTFTATGDAILRAGATPLFVDINLNTYNIDPERINEALKTPLAKRVVGILPVHLYGKCCEIGEIIDLANKHDLFIVEDVAQAFGGTWNGKKLGSIGSSGCFSFFPSKNLGGYGDGGMVSTNDDESAEIIKMLLMHGGKNKYDVKHIGYNSRLDTLQAAILLVKIKYLDEFNKKRVEIAKIYNESFQGLEDVAIPSIMLGSDEGLGHVFHQYTLRLIGFERDTFQKHLINEGIATMVYYGIPLHSMEIFQQLAVLEKNNTRLINTDIASDSVISLPIEPLQDISTTNMIVETICNFLE